MIETEAGRPSQELPEFTDLEKERRGAVLIFLDSFTSWAEKEALELKFFDSEGPKRVLTPNVCELLRIIGSYRIVADCRDNVIVAPDSQLIKGQPAYCYTFEEAALLKLLLIFGDKGYDLRETVGRIQPLIRGTVYAEKLHLPSREIKLRVQKLPDDDFWSRQYGEVLVSALGLPPTTPHGRRKEGSLEREFSDNLPVFEIGEGEKASAELSKEQINEWLAGWGLLPSLDLVSYQKLPEGLKSFSLVRAIIQRLLKEDEDFLAKKERWSLDPTVDELIDGLTFGGLRQFITDFLLIVEKEKANPER
ncbi:hypothetical protein KKE78_00720 [Patescibacteria group bacterium]|nr:hypothetical protein [Patescibacteria group bacterium]